MNKPHVHADAIKAWADGAEIEYKYNGGTWISLKDESPTWNVAVQYRVKPKQYERWFNIYEKSGFSSKEVADKYADAEQRIACVKAVFTEGEGL